MTTRLGLPKKLSLTTFRVLKGPLQVRVTLFLCPLVFVYNVLIKIFSLLFLDDMLKVFSFSVYDSFSYVLL